MAIKSYIDKVYWDLGSLFRSKPDCELKDLLWDDIKLLEKFMELSQFDLAKQWATECEEFYAEEINKHEEIK